MDFEPRGKWVRHPMEFRSADGVATVEGYAAVFNQVADIGGLFNERIAPGAFAEAIGRDDVIFSYNHDDNTVMARTGAGTLDLAEDERGLKIRARLATDDPDVARLVSKIRHNSINKMSFAFWVEPGGQELDDSGDVPLRTITRASLHDVSAVVEPAYEGTEIGMRFVQSQRKEQKTRNFSAAQLRVQLKGNLELKVRENG